jgi:hypothetical protein
MHSPSNRWTLTQSPYSPEAKLVLLSNMQKDINFPPTNFHFFNPSLKIAYVRLYQSCKKSIFGAFIKAKFTVLSLF